MAWEHIMNVTDEWGSRVTEYLVGGDNYVGRSLTFVLAGGEESEAA